MFKRSWKKKIYPELVADVFVEIEFSMDLESKLDRDQPWIFELNDQQFIIENATVKKSD